MKYKVIREYGPVCDEDGNEYEPYILEKIYKSEKSWNNKEYLPYDKETGIEDGLLVNWLLKHNYIVKIQESYLPDFL